ncbi:MAG TPA: sigma-70 family RNA polymerase sigma factor [Gemmatales bacterium]|nr:sigma-70 family RNA polymerase sigma factor [Gemmatales bacterium]
MSTWGPVLRRLQRQEPHETATDAELLQQFLRAQSSSAFETIVRRHGPLVLRLCQRELPVLADAEDAFQATFLVLAKKARSIRKESSLAAWLAGIARRLARRLAQQLRRRRERLAQMHKPPWSSTSASPPSWWDDERRLLPQEYQTVIDLCLIQGLTRDEAARQLGQSPAAVHGLLYRARLKLKKQLIQRGTVVGASLAGTQVSASVIDRLAPALADAAVSMLKQGSLTGGVISPAVLGLVTSRGISAWLIPTVLASGLLMGGLSWWAVTQLNQPGALNAPIAAASSSVPQPPLEITVPQVIVDETNSTQHLSQSLGQPPPPTQTSKVQMPQQQAEGLPPVPGQPPQQQAKGDKNTPYVPPAIPVPPADRVPTGSERLNLAQGMLSSAGSLNEGMIPLLPHQSKHSFDGKTLLLSVITSEKELRNCTEKAPPVKFPPNVQVMNDPAWDGNMFQIDWEKDVLLVTVVLEEANSVTLQARDKCWIAPDKNGVGHLFLLYDGKEQHTGFPGIKSYPYVMLKVPRKDLQQVAVSVWRAGDKPAAVATMPKAK